MRVILRERALSVMDGSDVLTFDLEGRPVALFLDGRTFWRGLSGDVVEKRGSREQRAVRHLDEEERRRVLEQARHTAQVAAGHADRGARVVLTRAAAFDANDDEARFRALYSPVGILPPDQYMAVVLQATEGCPWNRCTFCDFYRDVPFRIKGAGEFAAHARAVRAFLGEGARLRQTMFLGDANVLALPPALLASHLTVVRETFGDAGQRTSGDRSGGIFAFVDAFGAHMHTNRDLRTFGRLGLRRVYIGLETGDDELLAFLRKRGAAADVVGTVRAFKTDGIAVGVIVMLGIGGDRYADAHVAHTADTLAAMALGRGDVLYFSPLVVPMGTEYAAVAASEGMRALSPAEAEDQRAAITARLAFSHGRPLVATYDIREFIY